MKIAVSYLKSKDDLEKTVQRIDKSMADYIHVDIMDGKFVLENNNDLLRHIKALKDCQKKLDVHLMMQGIPLLKAIEAFSRLNPEYITVHVEIEELEEVIKFIQKKKIKIGLAINPDTYIIKLRPYLKEIQKIIVMSVYPGKGGQKFIEETPAKLKILKEIISDNSYPIELEVDGGINDQTISLVSQIADTVVSGSFICLAEDIDTQIKKIKNA